MSLALREILLQMQQNLLQLETGAVVRVPLFINEGEVIQIDTRDGSYLGRVNS